jgi:drug/metabolite transporter (DMT)-like permease
VCLGAAALVYAPFAALTFPKHVPSVQVLLSLAALGVICTAAAFLVFFRLIAEVGPARATVITYVNPAVAVALGVLVLGEHLTAAIGVSFVLILGGSVLATRPGSGAKTRAASAPEGTPADEEGATMARSD